MKRISKFFEVDFLQGPIIQSLIIFAIPLFISSIFQQMYNMVDTMIVGNYLGDEALAAMGACASISDLMVGFCLGVGNGMAVVTARSYGAGNMKLLKKSVKLCFQKTMFVTALQVILLPIILRQRAVCFSTLTPKSGTRTFAVWHILRLICFQKF